MAHKVEIKGRTLEVADGFHVEEWVFVRTCVGSGGKPAVEFEAVEGGERHIFVAGSKNLKSYRIGNCYLIDVQDDGMKASFPEAVSRYTRPYPDDGKVLEWRMEARAKDEMATAAKLHAKEGVQAALTALEPLRRCYANLSPFQRTALEILVLGTLRRQTDVLRQTKD